MPYDTESKSRNADFISIARRAIHNPRPERPSNLRTLRTFGAQPRQSSHRRRVQWRSRIGGGERSEPTCRMHIMPYDTESKSRNADFISIARRAIRHPLNPLNLLNPLNPHTEGVSKGGHNLRPKGPSTFPSEPSAPGTASAVPLKTLFHYLHGPVQFFPGMGCGDGEADAAGAGRHGRRADGG